MRSVQPKLGKSRRGVWTPEQKAYADRCCAFGCLYCYVKRGIAGTPGEYHHQSEGYNGLGMRAPHHMGCCLCPFDHDEGPESVHLAPRRLKELIGYTETELIALSHKMHGWEEKS